MINYCCYQSWLLGCESCLLADALIACWVQDKLQMEQHFFFFFSWRAQSEGRRKVSQWPRNRTGSHILLMLKLCFLVPRNLNVTFTSNMHTHTQTTAVCSRLQPSVSARCETEMWLEPSRWNTWAATVLFFEKLFMYQLGEKTFEIYWRSQWCHYLTWVACTQPTSLAQKKKLK